MNGVAIDTDTSVAVAIKKTLLTPIGDLWSHNPTCSGGGGGGGG